MKRLNITLKAVKMALDCSFFCTIWTTLAQPYNYHDDFQLLQTESNTLTQTGKAIVHCLARQMYILTIEQTDIYESCLKSHFLMIGSFFSLLPLKVSSSCHFPYLFIL